LPQRGRFATLELGFGLALRHQGLVGSCSGQSAIHCLNIYEEDLMAETGKYADQEFQAHPAAADAAVPARFLELQNGFFGYARIRCREL